MLTRRHTLGLLAAAPLAGLARPALAAEPMVFQNPFAINGYDPVAYFTQGAPVPGVAAHAVR